jgi:hypothetical protein
LLMCNHTQKINKFCKIHTTPSNEWNDQCHWKEILVAIMKTACPWIYWKLQYSWLYSTKPPCSIWTNQILRLSLRISRKSGYRAISTKWFTMLLIFDYQEESTDSWKLFL